MATTRLQIQTEIYEILQKTSTAYGLYTPTKLQAMLNDTLDFIASKMMKVTNGWLVKQAYANITADSHSVTLPTGVALINWVKIKSTSDSTDYVPISFSENSDGTTSTESVPISQAALVYHLVNGAIHLEPKPSESITNGILIEYTAYPAALTSDSSELSSEMDLRPFVQFAKWRTASMLYSLGSDGSPSWSASEEQWYQVCVEIISRRFRQPTAIKEFTDF